jgi:uncharacterized RDD family membrane protein YckC
MPEDLIRVPSGLTTDGLLGRRYLARLIDTFVIMLLLSLPASAIGAAIGPPVGNSLLGPLLMLPLILALWIGYGALMESSRWQATVGERVMGLRVYNSQGGPLDLLQVGGRNLVKDGPFLVLVLIPGGRWLAFSWLIAHLVVIHRSPVNQAIHDRVAHTWVAAPEEMTQLRLS